MNNYHYQHKDGRTGHGQSSWAAIVDAIGADEARALPQILYSMWTVQKDPYEEMWSRFTVKSEAYDEHGNHTVFGYLRK